eukprot:GHVP01054530.1.p1 GENE.GHVP01054530.1~~GHVP01054530.1.p1  ORF type:complete len:129 (+),score=9.44 GHVP01054530.1:32-418(+)
MILFKDLQDKITAASCDVEIPNYQLNHSSQIDDNLSEPQFRVHDGLFSGENFTHVVRSAPRNTFLRALSTPRGIMTFRDIMAQKFLSYKILQLLQERKNSKHRIIPLIQVAASKQRRINNYLNSNLGP